MKQMIVIKKKLVHYVYNDIFKGKKYGDYNEEDYKGGRRNKPNFADMTMKDVKELCKANQIKLSRVVNDKRVVYTKKELLTKLKRKKVI